MSKKEKETHNFNVIREEKNWEECENIMESFRDLLNKNKLLEAINVLDQIITLETPENKVKTLTILSSFYEDHHQS